LRINFKLFLNFSNDMLTRSCGSQSQSWLLLNYNDRWPNCVGLRKIKLFMSNIIGMNRRGKGEIIPEHRWQQMW